MLVAQDQARWVGARRLPTNPETKERITQASFRWTSPMASSMDRRMGKQVRTNSMGRPEMRPTMRGSKTATSAKGTLSPTKDWLTWSAAPLVFHGSLEDQYTCYGGPHLGVLGSMATAPKSRQQRPSLAHVQRATAPRPMRIPHSFCIASMEVPHSAQVANGESKTPGTMAIRIGRKLFQRDTSGLCDEDSPADWTGSSGSLAKRVSPALTAARGWGSSRGCIATSLDGPLCKSRCIAMTGEVNHHSVVGASLLCQTSAHFR